MHNAIGHINSNQVPQIWTFESPTEYLKRIYECRKATNQHFSYNVWAQELGIKSRSFLRLVLIGKRSLTEDLAIKLTQNLNLKKNESQYFLHLVGLQRASEIQSKEYHSRQINKLREKFLLKKQSILEVSQKDIFNLLANYRIPRLQVLLTLKDIRRTPGSLAKLLSTKESDVLEMLANLKNIGLAQSQDDGQWEALEAQVAAPDNFGHIALQSFHRKSLEEAMSTLSEKSESRKFQSAVMTMTPEQFAEVHNEMREYLGKIINKFENTSSLNTRVYQLNINLIPVTRPIDQADLHETVGSEQNKKENI